MRSLERLLETAQAFRQVGLVFHLSDRQIQLVLRRCRQRRRVVERHGAVVKRRVAVVLLAHRFRSTAIRPTDVMVGHHDVNGVRGPLSGHVALYALLLLRVALRAHEGGQRCAVTLLADLLVMPDSLFAPRRLVRIVARRARQPAAASKHRDFRKRYTALTSSNLFS